MAQKAISEFFGKSLIYKYLPEFLPQFKQKYLGKQIDDVDQALPKYKTGYVIKPDQLFGKRGKNKLVFISKDQKQVHNWLKSKFAKTVTVFRNKKDKGISGILNTFLVEPFVKHDTEYYLAFKTEREHDTLFFSLNGGIEVEENWQQVSKFTIPFKYDPHPLPANILKQLIKLTSQPQIVDFISALYQVFKKLDFTYLEINPLVLAEGKVEMLDLVARLDDTAYYKNQELWSVIPGRIFPSQFGVNKTKYEEKVARLDEKSGASLKISVLNPQGSIWLLTSGGGGSVIFADTVGDIGYQKQLANYCDYSGNPNTDETAELVENLILQMLESKAKNKVLIIAGGIANFTDIKKTFLGVVTAIRKHYPVMKSQKIQIFVRRGGPNYKEGLKLIADEVSKLGLQISVFGPEMYMTEVIKLALKNK